MEESNSHSFEGSFLVFCFLFICLCVLFYFKMVNSPVEFSNKNSDTNWHSGHTPVISALRQVISEFEVELVYTVNPRPARATQ